jgi:hypothetical protein
MDPTQNSEPKQECDSCKKKYLNIKHHLETSLICKQVYSMQVKRKTVENSNKVTNVNPKEFEGVNTSQQKLNKETTEEQCNVCGKTFN